MTRRSGDCRTRPILTSTAWILESMDMGGASIVVCSLAAVQGQDARGRRLFPRAQNQPSAIHVVNHALTFAGATLGPPAETARASVMPPASAARIRNAS